MKTFQWSKEVFAATASFGCCVGLWGSDISVDPCIIIRECLCELVLANQITEQRPQTLSFQLCLPFCFISLLLYFPELARHGCFSYSFLSAYFTFGLRFIDCCPPSFALSIGLLVSPLRPSSRHCHPCAVSRNVVCIFFLSCQKIALVDKVFSYPTDFCKVRFKSSWIKITSYDRLS